MSRIELRKELERFKKAHGDINPVATATVFTEVELHAGQAYLAPPRPLPEPMPQSRYVGPIYDNAGHIIGEEYEDILPTDADWTPEYHPTRDEIGPIGTELIAIPSGMFFREAVRGLVPLTTRPAVKLCDDGALVPCMAVDGLVHAKPNPNHDAVEAAKARCGVTHDEDAAERHNEKVQAEQAVAVIEQIDSVKGNIIPISDAIRKRLEAQHAAHLAKPPVEPEITDPAVIFERRLRAAKNPRERMMIVQEMEQERRRIRDLNKQPSRMAMAPTPGAK